MEVDRFARREAKELKGTHYLNEYISLIQSTHVRNVKIMLLEGLRDEIKLGISSIKRIQEHLNNLRHKKDSENAKQPTESELWNEIDAIEGKILNSHEQKIENNNTIQDYDDQLYEQERVLNFKRQMNNKLSQTLQTKRKQLAKLKMKNLSNSVSTGVDSALMQSPRVFSSPRITKALNKLFSFK